MKIISKSLINSIIKKAYFYLPKILLSLVLVTGTSPYAFTQGRLKIDDLKSKKTRLDLDSISTSTRLNLDSTITTNTKGKSLTRLNLDEYGQKLNIKQIGESSVQTTRYIINLSVGESVKKPIKRTLSEWELLTEKANKIIDKEIVEDSDIEEAVKLYNKALELNPKTILPYLGLGYAHLRVRNFEKSIFYYQEATKQNPKNIEAKTNLAVAIYYTGKIDEAIKEYTEALAFSKSASPELNFNLAIAYAHKGNFEEAIEYYKKALAQQKNYAEVYNNLGLIYEAKDDVESATNSFKEAIKLKKGNYPLAYYNLARLQISNRDYNNAIKSLMSAIEQKKTFSQAYLTLGNAYLLQATSGQDLKLEDIDLAIKNYRQAIELNNNFYPLAHENLAIALSQKDADKEAFAEFRLAVEQYEGKCPKTFSNLLATIDKKNRSPIYLIGDELADRDNPSSLKRRYRDLQVLKKNASNLDQEYKTQLLESLEEFLQNYENLDDEDKNLADIRFCAGRIYLVTSKWQEAINEFDIGLKLSENKDKELLVWLKSTLELLFYL